MLLWKYHYMILSACPRNILPTLIRADQYFSRSLIHFREREGRAASSNLERGHIPHSASVTPLAGSMNPARVGMPIRHGLRHTALFTRRSKICGIRTKIHARFDRSRAHSHITALIHGQFARTDFLKKMSKMRGGSRGCAV